MNTNLKIAAALVVAAIAGGALTNWLRGEPQPVIINAGVVEKFVIAAPQTPDPSEVLFTKPLSSTSPLPAGAFIPKAANEFGRKLLDAKDVKAFVLDALKHPEKGGAFYAGLALRECAQGFGDLKTSADETIQKTVAKETTISSEKMVAVNAALTRCAGFSAGEIDALRAEVLQHAADGSDPLAAMQLSITTVKTKVGTPERAKLVQAIYESGSQALISEVNVPDRFVQLTKTVDDRGMVTARFNGQSYTAEDLNYIDAATELGTCFPNDYCAIDLKLQQWCRNAGKCYATRDDYVLGEWFHGDEAAFAKAKAFGDQIRAAIARGDTSIFR